jgi:hypothetical protein
MSTLRSSTLYVSSTVARNCESAAQLLGLESGDAYAELALTKALAEIPQIADLQHAINNAIRTARRQWEAANQPKGEEQ